MFHAFSRELSQIYKKQKKWSKSLTEENTERNFHFSLFVRDFDKRVPMGSWKTGEFILPIIIGANGILIEYSSWTPPELYWNVFNFHLRKIFFLKFRKFPKYSTSRTLKTDSNSTPPRSPRRIVNAYISVS